MGFLFAYGVSRNFVYVYTIVQAIEDFIWKIKAILKMDYFFCRWSKFLTFPQNFSPQPQKLKIKLHQRV